MTIRINGQDVAAGDIDDGRPERIKVQCHHEKSGGFWFSCRECNVAGDRDETDAEYWARVEHIRRHS